MINQNVAGVGGFEPPHDGIKNRCLTAWLHPINPVSSDFITEKNIQIKYKYTNQPFIDSKFKPNVSMTRLNSIARSITYRFVTLALSLKIWQPF